jgi:hypothetical protein
VGDDLCELLAHVRQLILALGERPAADAARRSRFSSPAPCRI